VWLRSLLRTPLVGEGLFNILASKPSIRYFLVDHGFAEAAHVTEEWVEYDWRTTHQPGARYAPASFVSGFLDLDLDLGAALAEVDEPVTVVWGGRAELPPLDRGRELAERAGARLLVLEDADLLPHAEYPATFVETVRPYLEPSTVAGADG
jgi:pimeloyl-ACP methyl ester carboxylesterase